MEQRKKVLVALSGGVDSSAAAALLQAQGYDIIGVTLRFLPGSAADELEKDARRVAAELGIYLHVVDLSTEFEGKIIKPFCRAYMQGRTPNPCIICNQEFKFGYLLSMAESLGCEYLATGHYARVVDSADGAMLARGVDLDKDQSYFMFCLAGRPGADLNRVLFPLGGMTKEEVRAMAIRFGLGSQNKDESQDICFIPDNDYKRMLESRSNSPCISGCVREGDIVHVNGTLLGHHGGIYAYTVGQRRGLGVAWSEPLYVVRLDAEKNLVVVGEKKHLLRPQVKLEGMVLHPEFKPRLRDGLRIECQIRYRQHAVPARVSECGSGAVLEFDTPQTGVSPGQAAVFYAGELLIGGGWIC